MSHRPDATDGCFGPEAPSVKERQALDLVSVLQILAAWKTFTTIPPALAICYLCGSLERADRHCQVCDARRRDVA